MGDKKYFSYQNKSVYYVHEDYDTIAEQIFKTPSYKLCFIKKKQEGCIIEEFFNNHHKLNAKIFKY